MPISKPQHVVRSNPHRASSVSASAHNITGLILAGGCAHRMDFRDKGLQELDGKSLVAHVVGRLAPQVSTLVINANRHLDKYTMFGFDVCSDTNFVAASESASKSV